MKTPKHCRLMISDDDNDDDEDNYHLNTNLPPLDIRGGSSSKYTSVAGEMGAGGCSVAVPTIPINIGRNSSEQVNTLKVI
mmetsp:Transcript_14070/g.19540  ORF Transcript_14070/g.19540 Transcript_14070/m.19540 type:complete len:80 (+) Transcript_14070:1087-1326(+)